MFHLRNVLIPRGSIEFLKRSRTIKYTLVKKSFIHIQVSPSVCLVDQNPRIRVTSAVPNSDYTIKGSISNGNRPLVSHAHFKTSPSGEIDVASQPSLGGSYVGVDEAGLLWSLQSLEGSAYNFLKVKDVNQPIRMQFSVYKGALSTQELELSDAVAECVVERKFVAEHVESHEVSNGRLRGIVYKPRGIGPFPSVIDLHGAPGGLYEYRAALLASNGFAVYALPYCAYKDLTKTLGGVDMEYFEEALNWFSSQNFVDPPRIGLVGFSFGASVCVILSTLLPNRIRAVVGYSTPNHRLLSPLRYKEKYFPHISYADDLTDNEDRTVNISESFGQKFLSGSELTAIEIEKAKADFLFIAGEDDQVFNSVYCASRLTERLGNCGHHSHLTLTYPNTGHIIDPALFPLIQITKNPIRAGFRMVCGGRLPEHAKAQEHSWRKVKEFLKEKLA